MIRAQCRCFVDIILSDLIWVVAKRMTSIETKCLPCPKLNKIRFSFADVAISRERSGDSGFEFGKQSHVIKHSLKSHGGLVAPFLAGR